MMIMMSIFDPTRGSYSLGRVLLRRNTLYARTPTPVSFNVVLALAAKRVALGKSQTIACLDVSTAFLAKMKDEVYIKLDADTLRMIHEENM